MFKSFSQINDWEGWKNKKQSCCLRAVLFPKFNKKVSPQFVDLFIYLFSILDILFFHLGDPGPTSPPQTFSYRKTDQNYWLIRLATKRIYRLFYRSVNSIFDNLETTENYVLTCLNATQKHTYINTRKQTTLIKPHLNGLYFIMRLWDKIIQTKKSSISIYFLCLEFSKSHPRSLCSPFIGIFLHPSLKSRASGPPAVSNAH